MNDESTRQARAIATTSGVCGGRARVAGTRIPVWTIEALRRAGVSKEQILAAYPRLTRSTLAAATEYARSHADEMARDFAGQEVE